MRRWWIIGLMFLAAVCFSCSNKGGDGHDGGDGDGGDDVNPPGTDLTVGDPVKIDDTDVIASSISLAATPNSGVPWAIAYYKDPTSTMQCRNHPAPAQPTTVGTTSLFFAQFDGTSWTKGEVTPVDNRIMGLSTAGISLVFDNSNPLIAYRGGGPSSQCCVASDLIQATNNVAAWTPATIVTDSYQALGAGGTDNQQANCPRGTECTLGDMVGQWPSQAVARNGTIGIVYQDTHYCFTRDDSAFSDVEWAYKEMNGGWNIEWIDLGRGGGIDNKLVFDSKSIPAVAFYNGRLDKIYFSKRNNNTWSWNTCDNCPTTDYTCDTGANRCVIDVLGGANKLNGFPIGSLSLAVDPNDGYLLAYHDSNNRVLMLAYSANGIAWQSGIVIDSDGITGRFPNIMINPVTKKPVIVYYRCAASNYSGSDCDDNQDGVRLAVFVGEYPKDLNVRTKWKKYNLNAELDKSASDGQFVSAAIQPDGTIGVAYQYLWTVGWLVFRTVTIK